MIRVGVVGCKGIGIQHAAGAAGLESTEVAAGCDLVQNARAAFHSHWKERFPRLQMYGDHREMLAEAELDVVTVATSDHRHADIVVDAAEAGVRGVFCEKPLATTIQDADRMLQACRANGTVLAVDHTRRWQPLWRYAHEQVWGALRDRRRSVCDRNAERAARHAVSERNAFGGRDALVRRLRARLGVCALGGRV